MTTNQYVWGPVWSEEIICRNPTAIFTIDEDATRYIVIKIARSKKGFHPGYKFRFRSNYMGFTSCKLKFFFSNQFEAVLWSINQILSAAENENGREATVIAKLEDLQTSLFQPTLF